MRGFVVGIAGGSGSGKSTLARQLSAAEPSAMTVAVDWYYRDLSHLAADERARANFDHPDAIEWELLRRQLRQLRAGRSIQRPVYDFKTHTRTQTQLFQATGDLMVLEGILALYDDEVRSMLDLTVFVEAPAAVRLERRMRRDVLERGRTAASVREQFTKTVDPMHRVYVQPTRAFADLRADGSKDFAAVVDAILGQRHL